MKAANETLNARTVVERNREGKIYLRGRDPRPPFYMVMSVGNLDGSVENIENPAEGVEAIKDTEAEAIAAASETNDSYPTLECWIYHCVPVAKVWRGKTRVTRFK